MFAKVLRVEAFGEDFGWRRGLGGERCEDGRFCLCL